MDEQVEKIKEILSGIIEVISVIEIRTAQPYENHTITEIKKKIQHIEYDIKGL